MAELLGLTNSKVIVNQCFSFRKYILFDWHIKHIIHIQCPSEWLVKQPWESNYNKLSQWQLFFQL